MFPFKLHKSFDAAVQADCAPPYPKQKDAHAVRAPQQQHHQPLLNTGHHTGQAGHRHHQMPIYCYHDVQDLVKDLGMFGK